MQMSRLFFFTEQGHGGPQCPQQRGYRPLSKAALEESLVSGILKSSAMNGCDNALVRCRWNNLVFRGKGKEGNRETHGALIWKQTSKKLVASGDSWRDWLRTGVPGVAMLATYAPERATKALMIDWLIDIFDHCFRFLASFRSHCLINSLDYSQIALAEPENLLLLTTESLPDFCTWVQYPWPPSPLPFCCRLV